MHIVDIMKNNYSEKCYDEEEYISSGSKERRCVVRIFVKDLWK